MKKMSDRDPMDIRTDGRAYGILYVRSNVLMHGQTDRQAGRQVVRLSR